MLRFQRSKLIVRNLSTHRLNEISANITQPKRQGASQAMLYALGLQKADMDKPQVGISSVWYEGNPCNMHLLGFSEEIKKSVEDNNMLGMRFNTIGVSDGMSMGTKGMRYSLQSRDLIADSIETVMRAQWYDANISIPGCDKNMPGVVMGMLRVNRPSIMVYGGTIAAGSTSKGMKCDIVSAFQSYGEYLTGKIDEETRQDIVKSSCPGAGACGGMYTANTMACAIETIGLSLPFSSSAPALSQEKQRELNNIGPAIYNLLELNIKPSDIVTKAALENAIVVTMVMGGSTNAVIHLLAIAKSAGVDLTLDDFIRIQRKTPMLADFKPSGEFVMEDLFNVGGTPAVLKFLLEKDMIKGDCMTVTGKTLAENLEEIEGLTSEQQIVASLDKPLKETGHLMILKGSLAPDGAVAKITGKEGLAFKGPAVCFDSEEDMVTGFEAGKIAKGQVIVIRYEGPKGGPGMPEMLTPTSLIMGAGLGKDVALITDGRFSGGSHGFIIGHVTPEAFEGGPLALVQDGDIIEIDATKNIVNWEVSESEKENRKLNWKPKELRVNSGVLKKYVKLVSSASEGCVTDL